MNRTALYVLRRMLLNYVCFVLHVIPLYLFFLLSFVLILLYKIGGQFSERSLLWQLSGIFLNSTVIILICFMLCWRMTIMIILMMDTNSPTKHLLWDALSKV